MKINSAEKRFEHITKQVHKENKPKVKCSGKMEILANQAVL